MIEKNTYIFIAVRMKSSRLHLKAFADIHGKPLIQRLVERLTEQIPLRQIVICTSENQQDDVLAKFATENGINCFRGDELDVMGRFLLAAKKYNARTIVRVTGDNPLTDPYMLIEMLQEHLANDADYTYDEDLPVGTRSEIIDVKALREVHGQLSNSDNSEYMTYMLKRPDKIKTFKYEFKNQNLKRPELSLTIDTKEDLILVCQVYKHFEINLPGLQEIINYLDSIPDLKIELNLNQDTSKFLSEIDCSYKSDLNEN
mgnify:CR=1 FL=1